MCLSPQGIKVSQDFFKKISFKKEIVFISGKNRGFDNRIIQNIVDKEISLGDFILNCGEFAFIVFLNSLNRIKGDFRDLNYINKNSFEKLLFDYPLYSKPLKIRNFKVPFILFDSCLKKIENWRKKIVSLKTVLYRPDLKFGNNYEE